MESFLSYKKTLDNFFSNISYLYNGDAISSIDSSYSEIKEYSCLSTKFIIDVISNIYKESYELMVEKSKLVSISDKMLNEYLLKINWIDFFKEYCDITKNYIFCGEKMKKHFKSLFTNQYKFLPDYFSAIGDSAYFNPYIIENEGDSIIYITDGGIQSLVYIIQNMDYEVEKISDTEWKHIMNYNLYNCDYNSCKLVIKDLIKLRNDKINSIIF